VNTLDRQVRLLLCKHGRQTPVLLYLKGTTVQL
jgi:hypothetical protein